MPPKRSPAKAKSSPSKRAHSPDREEAASPKKMQKKAGWQDLGDGLFYYSTDSSIDGREKLAAFDLDGTIITTKSGKTFATNANDWRFLYPEVPQKLQDLYKKENYNVAIFTNQGGVSKGKTDFNEWKKKAEDIMKKIGVPMQLLVATDTGIARKPAPGMFRVYEKQCNGGVAVDKDSSIFCGDAAGRPASATQKKKDFSLVDRLFAMNVGLPFKTPEEFFLNRKTEKFDMTVFDPKKYLADVNSGKVVLLTPSTASLSPQTTEILVLVGPPGTGKSHFTKEYLTKSAYVHINRDTLKTWQKCVAEADKSLASGKSVVVDNTNPDKESRGRYVELAKKHQVPCRCFVFSNTIEHARHNNEFRELVDPHHDHVPDMIFHGWKNKYSAPTVHEGFSEVVEVRFIPKFSSKEHEELYSMYLMEK